MLLTENDNIQVNKFYMKRNASDFLGFLPVLDPDVHSYYSVSNEHPNKIFDRVSPVFGGYNMSIKTDQEYWYAQETLPSGTRHNTILEHEFYRDEWLERFKRCKYCVWFVGCDDGDKFMRFESKDDALDFLNNIDFFDEINEHPLCQNW